MSVFSMWWDDERGSTHLHPEPFESREAIELFAREKGITRCTAFELDASEVPYYFPKTKH